MKNKLKILFIAFSCFNLLIIFCYIFTPNYYLDKPNYIEIHDNNNQLIYSYNHQYAGDYVKLEEVSPKFIQTLLCTEDKNFYNHHGFDYKRIIKSLFDNLKSLSLSSGASTISQQLAKNLFLTNEKTLTRKFKEAFICLKLENTYSKDQILEFYLNSVYFAHNIYGIKTASEYYFHKQPLDLNYQESCLLVGVINAPNIYSPFINEEASNQKQKNIAYNLFQNNIITIKEYYDILINKSKLYGYLEFDQKIFPYYYQAIEKEIKDKNIYVNNEQGLIVETYLDTNVESIIKRAIRKYPIEDQISIIVMKPYSGEILSLIGGKDYSLSQYNRALDSYRQIGSTIKPFIYYLSLLNGLTPLTKFSSKPTEFTLTDGSTYSPKNSNNIYAYRDITMVEALAMSDNIYAVKASLLVGTKNIKNFFNSLNINNVDPSLAISLGSIEMTPLQLITCYNTLASEGIYYEPKFIKKISLNNSNIVYESKKNGRRVLKYDECLMINYLLQSPFDNGLITYSTPTMINYQTINQFACKTGTTTSSSWVVGFNQNYTILVYVGSDENNSLKDYSLAKKIWKDIANELTINEENSFYDFPSSLKAIKFHNGIYNNYSKNYLIRK